MAITEREVEGIVILDLHDPLTFGEQDLALRERLRALCQSGKVRIVINPEDAHGIDSTGVGTLVFALTRLGKAGGNLVLLNLNRSHIQLFVLTKLTTVLDIFDDEQDAVNSFFPGRVVKRYDLLKFVQQSNAQDGGG